MATVGMLTSSSKPEIIFVNDAILYPKDKNFGGSVDIMLLSSSSPLTISLLLLLLLLRVVEEVLAISSKYELTSSSVFAKR